MLINRGVKKNTKGRAILEAKNIADRLKLMHMENAYHKYR